MRTFGCLNVHGGNEISAQIRASSQPESFAQMQDITCRAEAGKRLYYSRRRWRDLFRTREPVYHALLPHVTFAGDSLDPLWINDAGRPVIAWREDRGRRLLLIGLNIEEEIVRHRQGDPAKGSLRRSENLGGYENERPRYLFEDQVVPRYRTWPWADRLGFFLAETFSRLHGYPLVEPLPDGVRGAVILTGDDDQADLSNYTEQLRTIGDLPITFFLHPLTYHTPETIAQLPPHVELGMHPDALDHPEKYTRFCTEQTQQMRQLTCKPIRTLRNHGFLNHGYLGHLKAWEDNGLSLDVNYPGIDGTALNASFLPMRVRRADHSWSTHHSLLTAFGDGMIFAFNLTERQAAKQITLLAGQIERTHPGVLVFNFHPQNIARTRYLHQVVLGLAQSAGWVAMGLESYLDWLETLDGLKLDPIGKNKFRLFSSRPARGIVLRCPVDDNRWHRQPLESWSGEIEVDLATA